MRNISLLTISKSNSCYDETYGECSERNRTYKKQRKRNVFEFEINFFFSNLLALNSLCIYAIFFKYYSTVIPFSSKHWFETVNENIIRLATPKEKVLKFQIAREKIFWARKIFLRKCTHRKKFKFIVSELINEFLVISIFVPRTFVFPQKSAYEWQCS